MKTLKAEPGAKRLIESLRNMGYDSSTAIADLVDNSITANASEIHIDISVPGDDSPASIIIADNGNGMDRDELHEAMRFGSYQEYAEGDLGKYGLGLKTASLGQCRTLTVSSKAKSKKGSRPRRAYMRWDLDHVYKTDGWDLLIPTDDELKPWESEILNHSVTQEHGTVVCWTNFEETLPLLLDADIHKREKFLGRLIDEVSDHLRMVFHRYMQGAVRGRRKLDIYVCGMKLIAWDPFCREEKTKELDILKLPLVCEDATGLKVKDTISVAPFILPREDEFSSNFSWKEASGPKNWNQQQGFYFYRNNRLLQAGGWSHLRSPDEHTKLLRVAVDFTSNLDRAFSINITKMRSKIPSEVRDEISTHVVTWAKKARERYDNTASKLPNVQPEKPAVPPTQVNQRESKPTAREEIILGPVRMHLKGKGSSISVHANKKGNFEISIPKKHRFSDDLSHNESDFRAAYIAMLILLEAAAKKTIDVKKIPFDLFQKIYKRNI